MKKFEKLGLEKFAGVEMEQGILQHVSGGDVQQTRWRQGDKSGSDTTDDGITCYDDGTTYDHVLQEWLNACPR